MEAHDKETMTYRHRLIYIPKDEKSKDREKLIKESDAYDHNWKRSSIHLIFQALPNYPK